MLPAPRSFDAPENDGGAATASSGMVELMSSTARGQFLPVGGKCLSLHLEQLLGFCFLALPATLFL
jgi:hypothetical protein